MSVRRFSVDFTSYAVMLGARLNLDPSHPLRSHETRFSVELARAVVGRQPASLRLAL